MSEEVLKMSFEPQTIEHLGVKMYSTLPPALAEMIANSYDACSTIVNIKLYDSDPDFKRLIIEDDGVGMSFHEVNEFFLRIGRNRRKEGFMKTNCQRVATGKKGLGKLALFGIGDRIIIETVQDFQLVKFILDWNEILKSDHSYEPKFQKEISKIKSGTTITLESLKRKTPYSLENLAVSLAMMFNFSAKDFKVNLSLNDDKEILVNNKLKYENIEAEFEWIFEKVVPELNHDYRYANEINGLILTTEKPLKPHLRGITLFSNGRMINSPEFFGQSESSHFFSYTTGWLNVDFVDNWDEDVISTNRQSIDWENEKSTELRDFLRDSINYIERNWREQRREKRRENIKKKTKVDVNKWYNTLPQGIQEKVEQLINTIDSSELPEQNQSAAVQFIHDLVPEYPNLHWRHIHPELRKVSEKYYVNEDYYSAFIEALKRYIAEVKKRSGKSNIDERALMQAVFNKRLLSVTKKFRKTDGSEFDARTIDNIEAGQQMLSEGVVAGGRNPIQHEEIIELNTTGLFSERDCLDYLSILSHLFKRLDDSEAP
ncbi:MAG: TIGR02391 family protein [Ginsengibacter sp.]